MPCPFSYSRLSSSLYLRWLRLRGQEGTIRLHSGDEEKTEEGDEVLPFFLTGQKLEDEGYTSAHLLLECILASLCNAACLGYLLYSPSLASPSSSFTPSSPPSDTLVYTLLALVSIPLLIAVSAGSAAIWSESRVDAERRKRVGRVGKAAVWVGWIACVAALWPILFFVMSGQSAWLQRYLAVSTALIQALLVKTGREALSTDDDDDFEEDKEHLPMIEENYRLPTYSDATGEKTLLSIRDFLLESRSRAQSPVPVVDVDEKKPLVTEEEEERLQIHSVAI